MAYKRDYQVNQDTIQAVIRVLNLSNAYIPDDTQRHYYSFKIQTNTYAVKNQDQAEYYNSVFIETHTANWSPSGIHAIHSFNKDTIVIYAIQNTYIEVSANNLMYYCQQQHKANKQPSKVNKSGYYGYTISIDKLKELATNIYTDNQPLSKHRIKRLQQNKEYKLIQRQALINKFNLGVK